MKWIKLGSRVATKENRQTVGQAEHNRALPMFVLLCLLQDVRPRVGMYA